MSETKQPPKTYTHEEVRLIAWPMFYFGVLLGIGVAWSLQEIFG